MSGIKPRVWIRKSDAQIGCAYLETWLGDVWFFSEFDNTDVITQRLAVFLDDHKDLNRSDFIDLGPLED